jgi:hypothetical protein
MRSDWPGALVVCLAACGSSSNEPVASVASAACAEPERYVVNDGVVADGDLTWQRAVDATQRSQADAAAHCAALVLDGASGFRVPDVHELQSLLLRPIGIKDRPDACSPSIDQTAFPDTPRFEHWSATKNLYVDFADGRTHPADTGTPFYVRCVRGTSAAAPTAGP